MNWLIILAAVAVGSVIPLQGALNARLGAVMVHPMQATLVSYIGGTIACIVALLVAQASLPDWKRVTGIDWYLYCGGFLGVIFVREPANKSNVFSAGYRTAICAKGSEVKCLDLFKLTDKADGRSRARPHFLLKKGAFRETGSPR